MELIAEPVDRRHVHAIRRALVLTHLKVGQMLRRRHRDARQLNVLLVTDGRFARDDACAADGRGHMLRSLSRWFGAMGVRVRNFSALNSNKITFGHDFGVR